MLLTVPGLSLVAATSLHGHIGRRDCSTETPEWPAGSFNYDCIEVTDDTNTTREYAVWIPSDYDENTKAGLIFSYHGAERDIENQRGLDMFTDPYFNTDHIVVYLQGLKNSAGKTTWEGAPGAGTSDTSFTSDLLDKIQSQFSIDTDRVYAAGKSQGGGFVGRLACDATLSTRFAAFAPVSGAYYNAAITSSKRCHPLTMPIECDPGRSDIPIMAFHGGDDDTINYFGGFHHGACLPNVKYWAEQWANRDGLSMKPHNSSIHHSDGGIIMDFGHSGLVKLVFDGWDIPHDWPATVKNPDNHGHNLAAFNASTLIIDFFGTHSLN